MFRSYPTPTLDEYRISFDDDQASVLDEVLNQTYGLQVHSRRSDGVVLLRGKGVGVEVITIDPRDGDVSRLLWKKKNGVTSC